MARIFNDVPTAKDQWAKMKDKPLKEKLQYLATYYGLAAFAVVASLVILISLITSIIDNSVPVVLAGTFYSDDITESYEDEVKDALCNALGLDASSYHIEISSSYSTSTDYETVMAIQQKLIARVTAADLDFLVGNEKFFKSYIDESEPENSIFADLSTFLSPDLFQELEDAGLITYYECSLGKYPFMINLEGSKLAEMYSLTNTRYFGIMCNTVNKDALEAFIRLYILERA